MYKKTQPFSWGLRVLVLLAAITITSSSVAATNGSSDWLTPARDALSVARHTLESFDPAAGNTEDLDPWVRVLGEIRLNAQKCVDARLEEIDRLKATLNLPDDTTSGDVPVTDPDVQKRLDELDVQLKACRTLLLDALTIGDEIRSAQQEVLKSQLLGRGPDVWTVVLANLHQVNTLPATVEAFFLERMQLNHLHFSGWILLVVLSSLAVVLGLWLRRRWRRRLMHATGEGISAGLSASLQACLAQRLPLISK